MKDQTSGPVISLAVAAVEFSNVYSLTIARLVTEKLELLEANTQLGVRIAKQQEMIEKLEDKVSLVNSSPKSESNHIDFK